MDAFVLASILKHYHFYDFFYYLVHRFLFHDNTGSGASLS